jgi:hypothetical protein
MNRAALALSALLASTALPSHAQLVFAESFLEDSLAPGALAFFHANCAEGELISGGYRVNQRPDSHSYVIEGSYPETWMRWTVVIRNISDRPIEVGGTAYAICREN